VIVHLKFPNIPIHFSKFIGPACSVDFVDLLIFKGTLLEVIEGCILLRFTFHKSQGQIENKRLFNFGAYECSNILMDINKREKVDWVNEKG